MIELSKKLKPLVKKQWELSDIQMLGVNIGDTYESIDRASVSDGNRLDLNFEQLKKESELSLVDKLDGVIEHGGWIRIGGSCAYRIESGIVVQFAITSLKSLGIKKEAQIVKYLGEPDEKNEFVRHGKPAEVEYYYEKNKFLLVWSNPFNKLLNINIGERISR
ncbi:MAG: hypothetical protein HRU20_23870 [Pseudomonadales bacterium]|nr:hypothetical protein [Pseudomonadales bacterium]